MYYFLHPNPEATVLGEQWTKLWCLTCAGHALWSVAFPNTLRGSAVIVWLNTAFLAGQQYHALQKLQTMEASFGDKVKNYMMLVAPFSLHFGWITIASLLNTLCAINQSNATAKNQLVAALISLTYGAGFMYTQAISGPDTAVAAAGVWALTAVARREFKLPVNTGDKGAFVYPELVTDSIRTASVLGAVAVGVGATLRLGVTLYRTLSSR